MTNDAILDAFRERVAASVELRPEGLSRYRVFTPFMFDDGDHLVIVLKQELNRWVLSDEGHTFMRLTYAMEERDFQRGTRATIIGGALKAFAVADREGELVLEVPGDQYGDALYSFIQAILKISDVTFLTRERVRSTFVQDFQALMRETVADERLTFNWHDKTRDPDIHYPVDCRVNGMSVPLMIYALPGDDKVQFATIALHTFERWELQHRSIGIFERQEEVSRKVLARFSDVCDKQFSTLHGNEKRIKDFIALAVARG